MPAAGPDELALYIHWPFCLAKCPYCDFNSHVRDRIDQDRYAAALRADLAREASLLSGRRLTSIYFGGGTPSLMEPRTVASLLDDAARLFSFAPDIEITLEANPTSFETARMADVRAAGVNRLSLGVQSLRAEDLRFLGRRHSAEEAVAALENARLLFPRVSFDLIYGLPRQDRALWREQLRQALRMAGDHLSLYQLTIEPGTAFSTLHSQGRIVLPSDEVAAALYEDTAEACAEAGFQAYEVSNYARPGQESRHNLTYWRYMDYAGIGPGAHGRITRGGTVFATQRLKAPERWAEAVEAGTDPAAREAVSVREMGEEALLMGLRLQEGVDLQRLRARTGLELDPIVDMDALRWCVEEGYLVATPERLTATEAGRLRLNALLSALLAG